MVSSRPIRPNSGGADSGGAEGRPARLVVTMRFTDVDPADAVPRLRAALAAFGECVGFVEGRIARSLDEPGRLLLEMCWGEVGAYRRALSSYRVKVEAIPLLVDVVDEPTAFEVLHVREPDAAYDLESSLAADAATVGLGSAAAGHVPRAPS